MTNKTVLPPIYTSFDSAYVIADYPYGFRQRTEMKIWIETNNKDRTRPQRVVSCTKNPATGEWNKVKRGTYQMMLVLFIDHKDNDHVKNDAMSEYSAENAGEFLAEYGEGLDEWHKGKLVIFDAYNKAQDELGIRLYGCAPEERQMIYARRDEILISQGRADLVARIK